MIKNTVAAFILLNSHFNKANGGECPAIVGVHHPSSIEKLASDCALQKNLANDKNVQDEHRKFVYDKLADKLATQIKQNLEDISLLTTFFNSNGQDLLMNSSEVAQSCRLDSIKKIETCNGVKTGDFQGIKLSMLKSKLPKNSSTPFKDDSSLFGLLSGKFYSDLGMKEQGNDLLCPLEGQSGSFMLKSQLDDISVTRVLDVIVADSTYLDSIFKFYPQLKIIKNTDDPIFINKFISFVKNKPANTSAKQHISLFFSDPKNQKILAPSLAKQCRTMNENINRFLCSDITQLGSLDDYTSRTLFNKLNTTDPIEDQYEVDFNNPSILSAYGMQCIAKENKLLNPNMEKERHFQSTDQWYKNFTENTRNEESIAIAKNTVDKFCSIYTCKDPIVKNNNSCKNGGPLSSSELSHSLGCDLNPISELCTEAQLKAISYMQGLEKIKQGSRNQALASNSSTSSSTSSNTKSGQETFVSGRLPNFAENYFGVEGSLKALGRPVTSMEINEKKKVFAENKLAVNEPTYSAPSAVKNHVTQQQNYPSKAPEEYRPLPSSVQPTFAPSPSSTHSNNMAINERSDRELRPTIPSGQQSSAAKANAESTKMREELEKMLADIKSTKQEIAEVQGNAASTSRSPGVSDSRADEGTNMNRAEQERLRRLEQSLNDKSQKLENYRRELDNRNFAQNGFGSEAAANRAMPNAPDTSPPPGASGATAGPGNSLKLSASAGPNSDKQSSTNNYSAAIIQSGVESSPLTVDELSKLSKENLDKLGIDPTRPFTLKVTFNSKTFEIPVKTFIHRGAKILGPIMDPKNKDLNEFLLKSPLFKQFNNYKFDKENPLNASL